MRSVLPEPRPDWGTDVLFDQATADLFPKSWLTEKIDAKAETLAESETGPMSRDHPQSPCKVPIKFP